MAELEEVVVVGERIPRQVGILQSSAQMSEAAIQQFVIERLIGKIQTAICVKVVAVHSPWDGLIDVKPLIYQQSAAGDNIDHAIIYNVPVARHQRGNSAIIMNPVVGDIGVCVIASEDISILKKVKTFCRTGSFRRHSFGDAIYISGVFNAAPTQTITFSDSEISIASPTKVTITAPTVDIIGNIATTGELKNNTKFVGSTHTHPDPVSGNTGVPN